MKTSKRLLLNTSVLTLYSFFIRSVEVSFNVYLTNRIGKSGIGLFSLIITVYSMAAVFSSGGIKLACTRLTATERQKNKVLKFALAYAFLLGSFIGIILFSLSHFIALNWIKDLNAEYPLKILALSLPFVSSMSAFEGYFTGRRIIARFVFIGVLGQEIKILAVVLCLFKVLRKGIKYSCSAVTFGILSGQFFSFLFCLLLFYFTKNKDLKSDENKISKSFFHIALPDALGSSVRSVLLTLEHLLIPVGFRKSGQSINSSMAHYGLIHAMALPIVLYPAAVLNSLSTLLIPEIAELKNAEKNYKIEILSEKIIKLTLLFAFAVSGIIFCFADKISLCVYHSSDCSEYLQILSPLIIIMYLDTSVDAILKGLDQQIYSMKYNILDSFLCVILVYTLIPRYSIKGYIFVLFISEIINWALSLRRLIKVINIKINFKNSVLKPFISITLAYSFSHIFLSRMIDNNLKLCAVILFTFLIYAMLLILWGSISNEDLKLFKSIIKKD